MNNNIKSFLLGALLLTANTYNGFAGTMGPICTPNLVSIACLNEIFSLGIQGLYLRPSYNGNLFSQDLDFENVRPDWNWGYRLSGSYFFRPGNDLSLNWLHYDADTSVSGSTSLAIFQLISPYSAVNNQLINQVNLTLGQYVDAGTRKHLHFFGGLQYGTTRLDSHQALSNFPPILTGLNIYANSNMDGIGPVTGIGYAYDLIDCVSLTASSSAALLWATQRYNTSLVTPEGLVISNSYFANKEVIPSLDAKIGLSYHYAYASGALNLVAGYEVLNYFNALPSISFASPTSLNFSDVGLYGPYFGINWIG